MKKTVRSKAAKLLVSLTLIFVLAAGTAVIFPMGLVAYAGYGGGSFDGFNWSLDGEGLLEIDGPEENMPGFTAEAEAPWHEYAGFVTAARISAPIKSIGSRAFADCSYLEKIDIPASVAAIGSDAFSGCSSLAKVYYSGTGSQWKSVVTGTGNSTLDSAEIITGSSRCGENAFWEFSDDGTLTISGSGKIWDFSDVPALPWADVKDSIKKAVISDGITVIGERCFASCGSLLSVTIGSSVVTISELAFCDCDSLESIEIPADVSYIDPQAFLSCDKLQFFVVSGSNTCFTTDNGALLTADKTTLICYPPAGGSAYVVPSGVSTIRAYAFYECNNLKRVAFPNTLLNIGSFAFYGCDSLSRVFYNATMAEYSSITIGPGNDPLSAAEKHYSSTLCDRVGSCGDNLEWTLNREGVLLVYCLDTGDSFDMWDFSTIHPSWYDYRDLIDEVVISPGVTSISSDAFYDCGSLASVTISDSVRSIEHTAFGDCVKLVSVTLPKELEHIAEDAFYGCSALSGIYTAEGCENFKSVSGVLFTGDLTGLVAYPPMGDIMYSVPDKVTVIKKSAFAGSKIQEIFIPVSVETISSDAFSACGDLVKVHYAGTADQWSGISIGLNNDDLLNAAITFADSPDFGQCGDDLVWNISEDGTLSINGTGDMWNFDSSKAPWSGYAENIKSVKFIGEPASIGAFAFSGCCNIKSVLIPESVISIGDGAFQFCDSLPSIELPAKLSFLGDSVFKGCGSLTEINISDSSTVFRSNGGVLTDAGGKVIICFPPGKTGSYAIPSGITAVISRAFENASISELTVPLSVTAVYDNAFSGCSGLTDVQYDGTEEQWKTITIGSGNEPLTNAKIHYNGEVPVASGKCGDDLSWSLADDGTLTISGTGTMADYASEAHAPWYDSRDKIKKIVIEDGAADIGAYAFDGCDKTASVNIPVSVSEIGKNAFRNCDGLSAINYAGSSDQWDAIKIGSGNEKLTGASVNCAVAPAPITSGKCGDDLSWSLSDDGTLTISGTGTMYDYSSEVHAPWYDSRDKIKKIVIEDGATDIGVYAFDGCDNAASADIPVSVSEVGKNAFRECDSLAAVNYAGSADQWDAIKIGSGNEKLTGASVNCAVAPAPVTSGKCGDDLSWSLSDDGTLTISGTGTMYDYSSEVHAPWYDSRDKIKKIVIEDGATDIGVFAFDGCDNAASVDIPVSVSEIGKNAFRNCDGLSAVNYAGSADQWDAIKIGSGNEKLTGASLNCAVAPAPVTSGKCGDDLSWSLSDDGTLTISGTGTMYDYSSEVHAPWYDSRDKIKKIVIEDGATDIGVFAFDGCDKAASADIPVSVSEVGKNAFRNCDGLSAVNYAGSADQWDAVKIGSGNEKLTGASVNCAVAPAPITSGKCGDDLSWSLDDDGTLTISGNGTMYDYSSEVHAPWYDSRDKIKKIVIEDGATDIGVFAFDGCDKAASADIPVSVSEVGKNAFNGCDSLASVNYAGSADQWDAVKIGSGNEKLTGASVNCAVAPAPITSGKCGDDLSWSLSDDGTLTITGTGDMYGYSSEIHAPWYGSRNKIKKIVVEDGAADISTYAFDGCDNAASVSLPASVKDIGKNAFKDCGSVGEVIYGGSKNQWDAVNVGSGNEKLTGSPVGYNGNPPATHTPGDINGDGSVNNKDLIRLMKQISSGDISDPAFDVNGDGSVNNKDLIRLMKYIAGDSVEIF